jgi:dTDP-4-amino-4,6-dideoxygalactose transaminase
VQAVIGRIQIEKIRGWTAQREAHADTLVKSLQPFVSATGPLRLPKLGCEGCTGGCGSTGVKSCATGCVNAYYKFYAYVRPENLAAGWTRDRIIAAINNEGVPCYQGSCSEVYLEKAFDSTNWRPVQRLPIARKLGETSLMFLVHPTLNADEIKKTCDVLVKILSEAGDVR